MVRTLQTTFLLILLFGCSQNNTETSDSQLPKNEEAKGEEVKTVDDIDGSLKNVSYVANGGIITDTIFHDQLKEKIRIGQVLRIDSTVYISYAKYSLEYPVKYDMSFYYDGHFISSIAADSLPEVSGELIDFELLISSDSAYSVGDACGNEDVVEFSEMKSPKTLDAAVFIHVKKPECSDWTNHMVLKKSGNHFEKIFELEEFGKSLPFKYKQDSILVCCSSSYFKDGGNSYDFEYDVKNLVELRNTGF